MSSRKKIDQFVYDESFCLKIVEDTFAFGQ